MYQIYPCCTQFCDCCTVEPPFSSTQLDCVVWGICTSSSFHVLFFLHVLCYVFHISSLSSFMGSFAPSLSHIPFMPCIHCLDFSHSAFPVSWGILRHLCIPIFSLSVHLICHLLHIPSVLQFFFVFFSRESAHPPLLTFHAMHLMCLCRTSCHLSFLLLWGILASPYFHILCISCGYLHMHYYSTTVSSSKPLNLSFLHVPLSFFQLSLSIPTFNFLSSVLFHQSLPL